MSTTEGTSRNRKFPGGFHGLLFAEGHSESSFFSFPLQHSSSGALYYWYYRYYRQKLNVGAAKDISVHLARADPYIYVSKFKRRNLV